MIADTGYNDDGEDINAYMGMAYSYFNSPGLNKHFKMVRPLIQTNGIVYYNVGINVDYDNSSILPNSSSAGMFTGWVWGDGIPWGQIIWGGLSRVLRTWRGLARIGTAGSIQLSGTINGASLQVVSFDIVYERGGVL